MSRAVHISLLIVCCWLCVASVQGITLPSKRDFSQDCMMMDQSHDEWVPVDQFSSSDLRVMATIHDNYGKFLRDNSAALRCAEKLLAACLKVESGGAGFSETNNGQMIVRFENHIFYDRYTNKGQDVQRTKQYFDHFSFNSTSRSKNHLWRSRVTDGWTVFHGNQTLEWTVLQFAQEWDDTAALLSISMGSAQIMGFNAASVGYLSVQEMFIGLTASLKAQFDAFLAFIKSHPSCLEGLQKGDTKQFALCYNGASVYADHIDSAAAYYEQAVAHKLCTHAGNTGVCMTASACGGTAVSGLCAGNLKCCVPKQEPLKTCSSNNKAGQCVAADLCFGWSHTSTECGAGSVCCVGDSCFKKANPSKLSYTRH